MVTDLMDEIAESEEEIQPLGSIAHPKKEEVKPDEEPDKPSDEADNPEEADNPDGENKPIEKDKPVGEEVSDQVKWFNEKFGTDLKSEDEIEPLRTDFANIPDYKKASEDAKGIGALNEQLKTLQEENAQLKEMYDPSKIFVNDGEYQRQQLLKKYPDYDPAIITKIINSEVDKLPALDALKLHAQLVDGDIYQNEAQALTVIEDTYGIDITDAWEDIDELKKLKIMKAAKTAKALFSDLKAGDGSEKLGFDILAEKKAKDDSAAENLRKLKEDWQPFTDKLHAEIGDIKVPMKDESGESEFVFKLGDGFRNELKAQAKAIADSYAKTGFPFTDESKQRLKSELKNHYILNNLAKILQAYGSDSVASYVEAQKEADTNPRKVKKEDAPPKKTTLEQQHEEADRKIMDQLG